MLTCRSGLWRNDGAAAAKHAQHAPPAAWAAAACASTASQRRHAATPATAAGHVGPAGRAVAGTHMSRLPLVSCEAGGRPALVGVHVVRPCAQWRSKPAHCRAHLEPGAADPVRRRVTSRRSAPLNPSSAPPPPPPAATGSPRAPAAAAATPATSRSARSSTSVASAASHRGAACTAGRQRWWPSCARGMGGKVRVGLPVQCAHLTSSCSQNMYRHVYHTSLCIH